MYINSLGFSILGQIYLIGLFPAHVLYKASPRVLSQRLHHRGKDETTQDRSYYFYDVYQETKVCKKVPQKG